jgi:CTP synthase (UTP-ammonia lyase)
MRFQVRIATVEKYTGLPDSYLCVIKVILSSFFTCNRAPLLLLCNFNFIVIM